MLLVGVGNLEVDRRLNQQVEGDARACGLLFAIKNGLGAARYSLVMGCRVTSEAFLCDEETGLVPTTGQLIKIPRRVPYGDHMDFFYPDTTYLSYPATRRPNEPGPAFHLVDTRDISM